MIKKHYLTDFESPIQPDSRETSPRSAFSNIFKRFEAKMESKFTQMLKIKTAEIVNSISATMEILLKESEVNFNMSLTSATNLSITKRLGEIKSEIEAVKDRSARDDQILADELIKMDDYIGS